MSQSRVIHEQTTNQHNLFDFFPTAFGCLHTIARILSVPSENVFMHAQRIDICVCHQASE